MLLPPSQVKVFPLHQSKTWRSGSQVKNASDVDCSLCWQIRIDSRCGPARLAESAPFQEREKEEAHRRAKASREQKRGTQVSFSSFFPAGLSLLATGQFPTSVLAVKNGRSTFGARALFDSEPQRARSAPVNVNIGKGLSTRVT